MGIVSQWIYCLNTIGLYAILFLFESYFSFKQTLNNSQGHKIKENRMNAKEFLRIGPLNDEQIWAHSFIENGINPHCVLILIGYRIDLLLFFFF